MIKPYEKDAKVRHVVYLIVLLFLLTNIVVRKYQREEILKWSSLESRLLKKFSYWEKTTTRFGDSSRAGIG